MKFKTTRNQLFEALQKVITVVPSKTAMPILLNVKMYTEDGLLKLMATDIEIMLVSWTAAEIIEEGATTLPARTLFEIIRELPSSELELEIDEFDRCTIKSSFGEYKISGQDAAEFPKLPVIESSLELTFDNDMIANIIDKTLFTCGNDDLRPSLNGVFMNIGNDQLTAVSTDTHRMSKLEIKNDMFVGQEMKALIPTSALNYLLRLLEDEGSSSVFLGEKHILFNVSDTLVFSRLIYQEQFPNYDKVLPVEFAHRMTVKKEELIASIKRVKIFASKLTHQVFFNMHSDYMEVSAEDVDFGGEGRERLAFEFDGDEFFLAFNAVYLLEVLQHIESERILFLMNSINAPVVIRPDEDTDNQNYQVLIMPVKVAVKEE